MSNQFPEIYIQFLTSILLAILLIGTITTILLVYQKKKIKQKEELAKIKLLYEKELIQMQLEIQEQLLTDIAMEIHDNVGQVMMLAKVNTTILQKSVLNYESSQLVIETKKLISQALEDITELSRSMHTDRILQMGVIKVICRDFENLAKKGLFEFEFRPILNTENEINFSKQSQLTIYRTFQEISKNIIKHSQATKVSLNVLYQVNDLIFEITDNGIGFESIDKSNQNEIPMGIGISSMQKRLESIKGRLDINSKPSEGTTIQLIIPNPNKKHSV